MLKTIETVIGHWVTFIKGHERLLITIIAAFVLIHYADKAYDAYENHLKATVSADNVHIAQIEQLNAKTEAELRLLKATVDANAKIAEAKIAASKQKLVEVKKVDAALPLPELSKHWEDMLKLSPGSITPQSSGTVAVTTDAAHSTVARLEEADSLEDQLTQTQIELKGCVEVREKQDVVNSGLKEDVAAQKKGREDDAKLAKNNIRHAYWRGFKHGFIVGVGSTVAAVVAILH
jgi:hypothetical protein